MPHLEQNSEIPPSYSWSDAITKQGFVAPSVVQMLLQAGASTHCYSGKTILSQILQITPSQSGVKVSPIPIQM